MQLVSLPQPFVGNGSHEAPIILSSATLPYATVTSNCQSNSADSALFPGARTLAPRVKEKPCGSREEVRQWPAPAPGDQRIRRAFHPPVHTRAWVHPSPESWVVPKTLAV